MAYVINEIKFLTLCSNRLRSDGGCHWASLCPSLSPPFLTVWQSFRYHRCPRPRETALPCHTFRLVYLALFGFSLFPDLLCQGEAPAHAFHHASPAMPNSAKAFLSISNRLRPHRQNLPLNRKGVHVTFSSMPTPILLCKFSASGAWQGRIPCCLDIFFRLFGCGGPCLKNSKAPPEGGENNDRASLDRYTPSPCQLLIARKISINI